MADISHRRGGVVVLHLYASVLYVGVGFGRSYGRRFIARWPLVMVRAKFLCTVIHVFQRPASKRDQKRNVVRSLMYAPSALHWPIIGMLSVGPELCV